MQAIKEVRVGDLKEGDILAASIGPYSSLAEGAILTPSLIAQIRQLDSVEEIAVLREVPDPAAPVQAKTTGKIVSEEDIRRQNASLADVISERINKALSSGKDPVSLDQIAAISEERNIRLDGMDDHDRKQTLEIINYVEQASAELDALEQGPVVEKEPLFERLDKRSNAVDSLYNGLLSARQEAVVVLEKIVSEFIEEAGPNRDASILLKDLVTQSERYVANHCLNVAVIALATAIELTRIMEDKLNDPALAKDIGFLRRIRFKTFTREELVKLGFAAFVHDIYFKKAFPGLRHTAQLASLSDRSHIERHPAESYHLMKGFEMDYHVNKAVLQHHEHVDGSGYPDGIGERMFSKYTAVIAFADRYVGLTQQNPFTKILHPTVAIKHMLTAEKAHFDTDVMVAFAKAATMVPIGSWVELEDGRIGYSSRRYPGRHLPWIRLVMSGSGAPLERPEDADPGMAGLRIKRLLAQHDLAALNPAYARMITD